MPPSPVLVLRHREADATIFDLDGVLTDTARVHAAAWKETFDPLLRRAGPSFRPFDVVSDYRAFVDGRARLDGVRAFLASRGIPLPEGSDDDPEDASTVRALGARKARLFLRALQDGIEPMPGAAALLASLRPAGIRVGVGSASKNCAAVLRAAGLDGQVDVRVDGVVAEELGLPGKPDPALFLEAARRLDVTPARTVLFEDALSGVEAGRRGGFARVVGVGHGSQAAVLRRHGADVVVEDLRQVRVAEG